MRILYHHWLSPFARKVRLVLHEKRLDTEERLYRDWQRDERFLAFNPAGTVPVLVEDDGTILAGHQAICEYLDEAYPDPPLLPRDPTQRAEARRLVAWFDDTFHAEVTAYLVTEKLAKRMTDGPFSGAAAALDSRAVRAGRTNIHGHMDYIAWLTDRRKWLAGGQMTFADLAAAAHLSLVDYAGDVPWDDHPRAKDWYARVKSRPSFRGLLADQIPGVPAPKHYGDLDF
jgi:glutathione S-transferase